VTLPASPVYRTDDILCIVTLLLKFFILSSEPFNAPGCIDELLFPREKRMALGTDFNTDILFGGSHLDGAAACAFNCRICICWMDVCFHMNFNPLFILDLQKAAVFCLLCIH
jgi:hypothetical protein